MAALDWKEVGKMENEAMVDSPRIEEGPPDAEAEATVDSLKPKIMPYNPKIAEAYDALNKIDIWYSIGVVNVEVGILMEKEVLEVNGDMKGQGRIRRLNAGESHKLGLSEMRGKNLMLFDNSNGGVTFISNSPSFFETLVVDERDGEVAREEVERGVEEASMLSS